VKKKLESIFLSQFKTCNIDIILWNSTCCIFYVCIPYL